MISMVVPTRNRAATLTKVAPSYFAQEGVNELVFVDDQGSDDTEAVVGKIAALFPGVSL
jgi:glycosyltransferase involved in cell wall biosynthesis